MGAIDRDRHRPWLAYALEESLGRSLLAPRDVIDHANPAVLVTQLPPAVIGELLSRALVAGTFSPAQVLESAPPALLAEHLDPEVMWRCLKETAERGGLSRRGGARSASARQWFASVLERALETDLISPEDVLRFLPPAELVEDAPRAALANLITDALARSTFDAALVLQHLTPTVIAEYLETSLVWSCIAEAAARHFELGSSTAKTEELNVVKPAAPAATPTTTTATATTTTTMAAAPVAPASGVATAPIAATAAAIAATVKSLAKPLDRDKPAAEKKMPAAYDKAAAAIVAASPGVTRLGLGASNAVRVESTPIRNLAPAATTAGGTLSASAPLAAATPATPAAHHEANEWSSADDLDVLEDQPLPFPLPR